MNAVQLCTLTTNLGLASPFPNSSPARFLSQAKGMRRTRASAYSRAAKARWADPVIGAKMLAAFRDPATLAKMREATKARWADPSMREKMIMAMREAGKRRRNREIGDN